MKSAATDPLYGPDNTSPELTDRHFGWTSKGGVCGVCKFRTGKDTKHNHFSSEFARQCKLKVKGKTLSCVTCRLQHSPELKEKRRVILMSSSTIFGAWNDVNSRNGVHIDHEVISNARIRTLRHIFCTVYAKSSVPCDVIIWAGMNNLKELSVAQIMDEYQMLLNNIVGANPLSTLVILPLVSPPMLAWLPGNGKRPVPLDDDTPDYLLTIKEINARIRIFNRHNAKHVPSVLDLATEGMRGSTTRNTEGKRVTAHHFQQWEGFNPAVPASKVTCLHLTKARSILIYRKIINYIREYIVKRD